ncbi:MAG TPA: geranylgeranyl reductase family protein [Xenococcaceae cyanobacterium]
MFDCIVVGAGPAGATAAYHLAKQGCSVLILEKASLPRDKPCGGGVSPAIADWFDCDFTPVIKNTVSQVKYTWKFADAVEIKLKDITPMWMVQRDEFDHFLCQQALSQGAELKTNTAVTGISWQDTQWQVTTTDGAFTAAYLIAADGVNGSMAQWLGMPPQQKVLAANLEVSAAVSERRQNLAYFDFGSLKNGFMWCFPKANGYAFSGAYVRNQKGNPQELKTQLTNFAQKFELDLSQSNYQEYLLNLWQESHPLHTKRAVIAGEAAGVVDPLIGEGIRPAIFTGMKAATAIIQALAGQESALEAYTEVVNQEWGSDLGQANSVAGIFYKFPKIAYKLGVKNPAAGQTMGKILCGELRYSDVSEKIRQKLKGAFIPGLGR